MIHIVWHVRTHICVVIILRNSRIIIESGLPDIPGMSGRPDSIIILVSTLPRWMRVYTV